MSFGQFNGAFLQATKMWNMLWYINAFCDCEIINWLLIFLKKTRGIIRYNSFQESIHSNRFRDTDLDAKEIYSNSLKKTPLWDS